MDPWLVESFLGLPGYFKNKERDGQAHARNKSKERPDYVDGLMSKNRKEQEK